MAAFLGFLLFSSFIVLIIGLVQPSLILFKSKNPTRLKIIGLWFATMVGLMTIGMATSDYENISETSKSSKIKSESVIVSDEVKEEEQNKKTIDHLKRELESIDKGVDFSGYKNSIESLQMELILFGAWQKTITDALNSTDKETNDLAKQLDAKVRKMQVKEFPLMRKSYAKIVHQKLWVEDIETEVLGSRYAILQFTGGIFANNRNKQDTQNSLSEILHMFRFKKVKYKWYEYDDNYTYYDLETPSDEELVKF